MCKSCARGLPVDRILIVEDDAALRAELAEALEDAAFDVIQAGSLVEFWRQYRAHAPTVILLDMGLPDGRGIEIATELRKTSEIPILFLSGRNDEIDRIVGLELGADDFIGKPCSPRELIARINAILRRVGAARPVPPSDTEQPPRTAHRIEFLGFSLNVPSMELLGPDRNAIELTTTEFDLLRLFLDNPQCVLSRDYLLDNLRGENWAGYGRTIDGLVSRLRRKITPEAEKSHIIKTVRGSGYIFTPPVRTS